MWYLYATQEEMLLAKCELTYLTNIVSLFENNKSYIKLTGKAFSELSHFQQQFADQMSRLERLFENNECFFANGKEIEILEAIYSNSKKLRDCFHEVHRPFLLEMDVLVKNKLTLADALIQDTIQLSETHITHMNESESKAAFEQSVNALKYNTQSLLVPLQAMRRSINQLSITHEKIDMTLAIVQRSLAQLDKFYSVELFNLHQHLISKLKFDCSIADSVKFSCDEMSIKNKLLNTNYDTKPTLWNEQSNKQKLQEDIDVVVQFITENMSFFYAPFYNKTKRLFTRWAHANAKELAEVSDGLIKNLPSEQAIELFSDALFSLKEDDDATSLIRILKNNNELMLFLKECADFPYAIIGKWDRYHKYDPAVDEWDRYYSVYR